MERYDPWRDLSRFEDVRVVEADLPDRLRGVIDFATQTITLCRQLRPVERRCTLAHELVHAERGPVLVRQTAREERIVAAIAAQRLVPLDDLADALRWSSDLHELAEELAVDPRTVRVRLRSLTDEERRLIRLRIGADGTPGAAE